LLDDSIRKHLQLHPSAGYGESWQVTGILFPKPLTQSILCLDQPHL
jgi:hypothetical protein